ncbi:hypothetical protein [Microbacterium indicum]|uniref:hypothetical protein n=1 Tax=Microbacterium indicum TaxID=358100 RepID=UPI000406C668|nr:hypothetical protein [Microbacterium indicum]
MTRSRRSARRVLAAVAGLALLAGAAVAPRAEPVEAAWVDAEAGSATFTAMTMLAPLGSSCTAAGGVLGVTPTVTLRWSVPAGMAGYTLAQAEFGGSLNGLVPVVSNTLFGSSSHTGTPAGYTSVANIGLLGSVLGATGTVAVRFVGPGGWRSEWLIATWTIPLLGLGQPTCTLSVQP